jgi:hypothetical protein
MKWIQSQKDRYYSNKSLKEQEYRRKKSALVNNKKNLFIVQENQYLKQEVSKIEIRERWFSVLCFFFAEYTGKFRAKQKQKKKLKTIKRMLKYYVASNLTSKANNNYNYWLFTDFSSFHWMTFENLINF